MKSWTLNLEETDDGSGDAILTFPPELPEQKGRKEELAESQAMFFNKLAHQKSLVMSPARDINDCLSVLCSTAAHFATH